MEMNYKVYVHISPSGKRYYGITKQSNVNQRWKNGKGYSNNQYFTRAINKYSWDNFTHIIVAKGLTEAEAKWLEIELIREWDTTNIDKGYNISLGGEGGNCSEETRKKIGEAHKGKKMSEEARKKMSEARKDKIKIYCVELDMYFNSINEASKIIGCDRSNISVILNGRKKTCGGYHWLYAEDVNQENINRVMSLKAGKTKIYCVELDQYFNSITEASEYINCVNSNISDVLNGRNKTAGGYHWLYAEDVNQENINRVMSEEYNNYGKGKAIKIYCVELDMYFNGIAEAGEIIGCHKSNISSVLRGKSKTAGGYHWLYANEVNEENINRIMSEEYNKRKKRRKASEESRKKISEANKKQVYCVELDIYFNSITEASEYVGCYVSSISKVLRGENKTCGGYHWLYAEDVEKIEIENKEVS